MHLICLPPRSKEGSSGEASGKGKAIPNLVLDKPGDVDKLTCVLDSPPFEAKKKSKVRGWGERRELEKGRCVCRGRPPVIPPRTAAKHSPLKACPHPDPCSNLAPAGARGPGHPLSLGPASTLPRCPRAGLAPVWQARPHYSPTATPASLPLKPETPDLLRAPVPRLPCEAPPSELSAPCAAGLWPPEHEFSQSRAPPARTPAPPARPESEVDVEAPRA